MPKFSVRKAISFQEAVVILGEDEQDESLIDRANAQGFVIVAKDLEIVQLPDDDEDCGCGGHGSCASGACEIPNGETVDATYGE
jgi:hypothetical protein